tara:strand:+ start:15092 stop:15766 length:675 start_codon:yes stop_codon:yes gene_type:complete
MWFLYGISTLWILSVITQKMFNGYMFNVNNNKSLDNHNMTDNKVDEYTLLCYVINYKDGTDEALSELTMKDVEDKNEANEIDYIIIKYMFNGKLMKYVTRNGNIEFPIYNFNVQPEFYPYFPDIMFLNNIDVTDYIRPYLGPLCNFYSDREEPIMLEDTLRDHPDFEKFNFKEGTFQMISNKTPVKGRKSIIKELPCSLIWKRHAAVEPKDEVYISNNFKNIIN